MNNSNVKFLRGNVKQSTYGTKVGLHKDVIQQFKGDWLNFEIKTNKDGKMYLQLDEWTPVSKDSGKTIITTQTSLPVGDTTTDDLPF